MAEEMATILEEWSHPTPTLSYNISMCGANDTYCSNYNYTWGNGTTPAGEVYTSYQALELVGMVLTGMILGLMILVTIIGNVFVIAAILIEKTLQNVANYLIVSLAVADLLVACLVMPLGAVYVVSRDWILGPELCDMWTSCDVLCCTASILHLVAIATDRFWAVTDVDYIQSRNLIKIGSMILLVWLAALIVSLAPQFGWKDPDYFVRISEQKCLVSQDVGYQIFATCSTFYVPLVVILILYWKIFQAARRRIRKSRAPVLPPNVEQVNPDENAEGPRKFIRLRPFKVFRKGEKRSRDGESATDIALQGVPMAEVPSGSNVQREETTAFIISESPMGTEARLTESCRGPTEKSSAKLDTGPKRKGKKKTGGTRPWNPIQAQREKKESLEAKRERKAAKTLSIITGAFVICWLPFFIIALLTPFIGPVSDHLSNFILWLGYFNSTLNPIIYTIFSPEFKQAFKKMLCGDRRRYPQFR